MTISRTATRMKALLAAVALAAVFATTLAGFSAGANAGIGFRYTNDNGETFGFRLSAPYRGPYVAPVALHPRVVAPTYRPAVVVTKPVVCRRIVHVRYGYYGGRVRIVRRGCVGY